MRHITTFEYSVLLFTHNWNVLFNKFQLEFYKAFDYLEMTWYVHIQRKGTKGEYHMSKLVSGLKDKAEAGAMDTLFLIYDLLDRLHVSDERKKMMQFMFFPMAYNRFLVQRELLDQMTIILAVKDAETLIDAGDLLGLQFSKRFTQLYGSSALADYKLYGLKNPEQQESTQGNE